MRTCKGRSWAPTSCYSVRSHGTWDGLQPERARVTEPGEESWESRPTRDIGKAGDRAKPGRCLEHADREVSEMESATTASMFTV